ncbi:DNA polymerase III subunit alpha [Nitrosomonas europaea]|uniref:DNA polymerase III subunit alpha n=1 Tax=Nitrosomonas europaea TaxID=915 RepID=UPI000797E35D|nr:DNA polymerase III subunit alpha [Nitrosomonas europaea]KXK44805.1 MAG: dnaE1 - DNA polymerase III (alpha chain) protein [Nitrosomonas europaea]
MPIDPVFIHLRLHSEYSVVDGIVRVEEAVAKARDVGMPALALTDLSNLFGLVKFYQCAFKAGIKPIAGCDVWVTNENDADRPFRLLLLCQSFSGYLLLSRLLSRAYRENMCRGRAELKKSWFREEDAGTEGLIALSGGGQGEVEQLLLADPPAAVTAAQQWADLFPGRFYLEIQRCGRPNEETSGYALLDLASSLKLPVVATHPVQFMRPEDFRAHEARVCIAQGYVLGDRRRPKEFTGQQYFKTPAEMGELFRDVPEALANSVEIARRCSLMLELGVNRLPDFPTPAGISVEQHLRELAQTGLEARLLQSFPQVLQRDERRPIYQMRLDFEVETIIQMGFAGYFLIVADFIGWAKQHDVPVGPGRGSGAGSLVAYSLGITDLDPLLYDLLFERFLNPERVSMPDFDIDFCQDRREQVIEYVRDRYGAESVAQIATFGTMAAKAVVRDVGRVLDLPYNFVDQLAKLVPFELGMTLRKAREIEPLLNQRAEEEEDVRNLLELAERLEGLTRNVGMHAGGVLIAPGKITDFCPVYCADSGDAVVSQYDKDDVEKVGLVKFDFLGLRTLTILDRAVADIRQYRAASPGSAVAEPDVQPAEESHFSLESISLEDAATFSLMAKGNTVGIFQFESRGMKDLLQRARPDRFEDLIALVALYRPGPMDLIPDFIERKHGKRVDYLDPRLQPILGPTYGIMIYQEQVMQIAQVIGGYSLGGADLLRRAMGKKKVEEMAQQRAVFVEGAIRNEMAEADAVTLFGLMEKFAGYGFNKSHAAAYALIAYQTAYLKTHYPAEFMAACMSSDMDDTDKVNVFYEDCKLNGIVILPPDINESGYYFVPVDHKTIRYGLGAVKGSGEAAISAIVQVREQGSTFTGLFDFCRRVDRRIVNRRTIEALIRAGAFDSVETNRAALLESVGNAMEYAEQCSLAASQVSLFDENTDLIQPPAITGVAQWPEREKLQNEKMALGFYLSGHPYDSYARELSCFIPVRLSRIVPGREPQLIAGVIYAIRTQMSRRGKMAIVTLDDGLARVEVVVYSDLLSTGSHFMKADQLLVVRALVSHGNGENADRRIVAKEIYDYVTARSMHARKLRIMIDDSGLLTPAQLKELLAANLPENGVNNVIPSSGCAVSIDFRNQVGSCEIDLSSRWRVHLHEGLIESLMDILGRDKVEVVY